MTKSVHDDVLDAALNYVKTNGNKLTVCEGAPTSYAEATTAKGSGGLRVGQIVTDSSDYTGPANGDTSGRKLTHNAQTGVAVDVAGVGSHLAVVDTVNSKLLYVTEVSRVEQTGTAQAGGASTITLAAAASANDDEYNAFGVRITSGTGSGQSRAISDYAGATKVATVSAAWTTQPDATSVYEVFGRAVEASDTMEPGAWDVELADPV